MSNFIVLIEYTKDKRPVYINKSCITYFGLDEYHGYYKEDIVRAVHLLDGKKVIVYESPRQIYELLKENTK